MIIHNKGSGMIKTNQYIAQSFLLIAIIVLSSCSKYKEEAPFFDGLVLEYL